MDSLNFWGDRKSSSSGWKQAAKVNCITLTCMSVVLISCLISAISRSGGLGKALFFYDGTCDGGNVSQVNMTLHLLINVVSTLVVSSLGAPREGVWQSVVGIYRFEQLMLIPTCIVS